MARRPGGGAVEYLLPDISRESKRRCDNDGIGCDSLGAQVRCQMWVQRWNNGRCRSSDIEQESWGA
eukprot:4677084-Pyramimonas_sp.AAC.1